MCKKIGSIDRNSKNQQKILEITESEMKNAFNGFISRHDPFEVINHELEDKSTETKLKEQRKNNRRKNRTSKNVGNFKKCNKYVLGCHEKREGVEEVFEYND